MLSNCRHAGNRHENVSVIACLTACLSVCLFALSRVAWLRSADVCVCVCVFKAGVLSAAKFVGGGGGGGGNQLSVISTAHRSSYQWSVMTVVFGGVGDAVWAKVLWQVLKRQVRCLAG